MQILDTKSLLNHEKISLFGSKTYDVCMQKSSPIGSAYFHIISMTFHVKSRYYPGSEQQRRWSDCVNAWKSL